MKLRSISLAFLAAFAVSACQGAEAVDALGQIKEKACSCEGDQACLDEATKMAKDWNAKYKEARGGDQAKAEEHVNGILECAPMVALALAGE